MSVVVDVFVDGTRGGDGCIGCYASREVHSPHENGHNDRGFDFIFVLFFIIVIVRSRE